MAAPVDLRESFPVTEDRVTGEGVALAASVEGQAAAGQQGAIGFSFKDAAGNLILPQLDAQGRVLVSNEGQGLHARAKGTSAGGVLVSTSPGYTGFKVVCSIPLAASVTGVVLEEMKGSVQCRRGALFQLIYQDAGNTVVLDEAMTDSGQYSAPIGIDKDYFSVPASAVSPVLQIRAGNFVQVSDLHSALKVVQF